MTEQPLDCLEGLSVVVVEDEAMIALVIEDALMDAGVNVDGRAATVENAISIIELLKPDGVTLDGNLKGTISGPVAQRLDDLGIRYLVVTGYIDLVLADPYLAKAPKITKPFTSDILVSAAARHLCPAI